MGAITNISVALTAAGVAIVQQYPQLIPQAVDYYQAALAAYAEPTLPGMPWLTKITQQFFGDTYGLAQSITFAPGTVDGAPLMLGTLNLIGAGEFPYEPPEPPGPPTTVDLTIRVNSVGSWGDPEYAERSIRYLVDTALAARKSSLGLPDAAWYEAQIAANWGTDFTVEAATYAPGSVDGMAPTLVGVTFIPPDTSPVPVNLFYRFTEIARDTAQNRALVRTALQSALAAYTEPSHPADAFYQKALDAAGLVWAEVTGVAYGVADTYGRKIVLGTLEVVPPEGPIVSDTETAAVGYVRFVGPWLRSQLPHGWDSYYENEPHGLWDADGIDVRAPDGSRLVWTSSGSNTFGYGNPPSATWSTGKPIAIEIVAHLNGQAVPHRPHLNDPVFPLPNRVDVLGKHNYPLWVDDLCWVGMRREIPGHWPNRPAMGTELTFTVPDAVKQRYPQIPPIDPACKIIVMGGHYTQTPYYFIRTYTESEQAAGMKNIVGIDIDVDQRRWFDGTVTSVPAPPPIAQLYALPSVQLETVTDGNVWDLDGSRVINRIPEDGEVEVPHTTRGTPTRIVFQLLGGAGLDPSEAHLRIEVDGDVAYASGAFESGWAGTVAPIGGAGLKVSFRRLASFESAHLTTVRVFYEDGELASWSFTWKDETAPVVEDAAPEGLFIVRVTFDEPVDPATALVPQNYRLRRVSPFAAIPQPTAAAPGASPREVWVSFDQPLTFGATYALEVSGITDRYGNMVADDAAEQRTFVAARPDVPDGRRFLLWDFIPDLYKRIDRDRGDLEKFIGVLQEPTDLLLYEVDRFAQIADPDLAPEDFVEAMLADLGCPFDTSELDLGDKRKLLSVLLLIYQQKGTTEGLIDAARALLGVEIEVHPLNEGGWMLGVHELYNHDTTWLGPETSFQRFAFEVTRYWRAWNEGEGPLTDTERARLLELIEVMRPAHTHFRRLNDIKITGG